MGPTYSRHHRPPIVKGILPKFQGNVVQQMRREGGSKTYHAGPVVPGWELLAGNRRCRGPLVWAGNRMCFVRLRKQVYSKAHPRLPTCCLLPCCRRDRPASLQGLYRRAAREGWRNRALTKTDSRARTNTEKGASSAGTGERQQGKGCKAGARHAGPARQRNRMWEGVGFGERMAEKCHRAVTRRKWEPH
jgi:hypothetical protein